MTDASLRAAPGQAAPPYERVLPRVWRWADPAGSDRCGTALTTPDGVVLIDPPGLLPEARRAIEAEGGPVRHVILTSARHARLAERYRAGGAVTVWAPGQGVGPLPAGIDRPYEPSDALPGGVVVRRLPDEAAPDGEVALLWPRAGGGLLLPGDILPVVGQTPVYKEGEAPPIAAYLRALEALLAAGPGALAPAHQAPFDPYVAFSTAYAAHLGRPYHARVAAPVVGPRYLVPQAGRVLAEALAAPVILRPAPHPDAGTRGRGDTETRGRGDTETRKRGDAEMEVPAFRLPDAGSSEGPSAAAQGRQRSGWIPDPFACIRCGGPSVPAVQTCGGPLIPRLCAACRAARRQPGARVMVCAGGCCTRLGARAVISAARQEAMARGVADLVDVVPVSCLGECSVGPFVRVSIDGRQEPEFAVQFRAQTAERARRYAAEEGEVLDDESEQVLKRFAARVQPEEAAHLVDRLADGLSRTEPAG